MSGHKPPPASHAQTLSLVARRTIRAPIERVFEAWTQPAQLRQWWGPDSVRCEEVEINLRIGGRYRIANVFPDGKVVWIAGRFEVIEPPEKLVYTWGLESEARPPERVTVRFEARDGATEVTVIHERILDSAMRDEHERGWHACLDGLSAYLIVA